MCTSVSLSVFVCACVYVYVCVMTVYAIYVYTFVCLCYVCVHVFVQNSEISTCNNIKCNLYITISPSPSGRRTGITRFPQLVGGYEY